MLNIDAFLFACIDVCNIAIYNIKSGSALTKTPPLF